MTCLSVTGTRGSVDFTEFPSHLLEHFILESTALSQILTLKQGDRALMDIYEIGSKVFGHIEVTGLALKAAVDQVR